MSPDEVRQIANESARVVVEDTLSKLGINATDPIEVQKDMHYLRGWRTTVGSVVNKIVLGVIGSLLTGLIAILVLGGKAYLSQ